MSSKNKTLVIGASENPARYANKAIRMLRDYGNEVYALGNRIGKITDTEIHKDWPEIKDFHSVTLYIGPARQSDEIMDNIIGLKPKRVIFNPGTENPEFYQRLQSAAIEVVRDCTLVMLQDERY